MKFSLFLLCTLTRASRGYIFSRRKVNPTIRNGVPNAFASSPQSLSNRDFRGTRLFLASAWEGDDLRWSSKIRRRFAIRRRVSLFRPWVIWSVMLLFMYAYQALTTIQAIRLQFPTAWGTQSLSIIVDTLLGTARPGPLTLKLAATSNSFQMTSQPYRFLTSGVVHDSLVHLALTFYAFLRLPTWLDTGLGSALYLTTVIASTIAGNWAVVALHASDPYALGATTGIAGLYGLFCVCLIRMNNPSTILQVSKGFGLLFLYGIFFTNVSNLAHIGGFFGGVVVGILSAPRYRRSYSLRRKNSVAAEIYSRDYRSAMGYDMAPTKPMVPLSLLWAGAVLFLVSRWKSYQMIPIAVWDIILHPLTGM